MSFEGSAGIILGVGAVSFYNGTAVFKASSVPLFRNRICLMEKLKYILLFAALAAVGSMLVFRHHFSAPHETLPEHRPEKAAAHSVHKNAAAAGHSVDEPEAEVVSGDVQQPAVDPAPTSQSPANNSVKQELPGKGGAAAPQKDNSKNKKPTDRTEKNKREDKGAAGQEKQAEALVDQAQTLIRRGSYQQAESLLRQSLALSGKNSNAWRELAHLYKKTGQIDQEMETFAEWSRAMPNNTESLIGLADVSMRQGNYEAARGYLAESEKRPDRIDQYGQIARLYRQMDDTGEEGRVLSGWMGAAPDSEEARKDWAGYQRRQGDLEGALAEYGRLSEDFPEDASYQRRMGDIYRNMGDYPSALSHYQAALEKQPQNPAFLIRLADTQTQMQDYQGAVETWSVIAALQPGSQQALLAERRIAELTGTPLPQPAP